MTKLRIVRLNELAKLPSYATPGDAGLDLCAAISKPVTLHMGCRKKVPTGLTIQLPPGHVGLICPRSGLAAKHGLTVLNAPGILDETYRGEVCAALVLLAADPFTIEPGMRVAQLVIVPCAQVQIEECASVDELSSSVRCDGGFGSTDMVKP